MHGDEPRASIKIYPPAESTDRKGLSGEGQHGSSPERDDNAWMDQLELAVQPPAIMPHLSRRRLLVNAPFTTLLEFEVLDSIGDVHRVPVHPGLRQRSIEQQACRSDKGSALSILLVAGLLAYQR